MKSAEAFRKQLKTSETVEEIKSRTIMTVFWNYMDKIDLENGQSVKLQDAIDAVFEELNKEVSKADIEEQVGNILKSEKYIYRLDKEINLSSINEDIIKLQLSISEQKQREYQKSKNDYAYEKLATFVKKVEMYKKELESKKIKITESSLRQQFSEDEQEKNPRWITLAIGKILNIQEQSR